MNLNKELSEEEFKQVGKIWSDRFNKLAEVAWGFD